jgi:hypothetical protein
MKLKLLLSTVFCAVALISYAQVNSVGIIGTATPNGWDSDTDLVQQNDSIWTTTLALTVGECKFRANDAWDINWGEKAFPIGIGTQNGPNIAVPYAGSYSIAFNSNSGEYIFEIASDIGIIGSATRNGWDRDFNLFQDPADADLYFTTLDLKQGECKFRANDGWDINWGANTFPTGIATQNGPNIPIPSAGKYDITFNKATGAYSFSEIISIARVQLIGSGVQAGSTDTLFRDPGNSDLWKGVVDLVDGGIRFRANDDDALVWGGDDFPFGTAALGGSAIPVTAGRYLLSLNTRTAAYSFQEIVNYATMGLIGDATPGGWSADTDMAQDPDDVSVWTLRTNLTLGECKFRANDSWTINWGGGDFPSGIASQDGPNIPIGEAGEYKITFNSTTGEYDFKRLIIFSTVGLIGTGSPLGNWDTDVDMTKDPVDEMFWTLGDALLSNGECKFRAEDNWTVNWGADSWPVGVGTQDGPNIKVQAGRYRVTLNTATGEYAFGNPVSTVDLLRSDVVKLWPNPVSDVLNIDIAAAELQGEVRVTLFNMVGAQVYAQTINIAGQARLTVPALIPGSYMVHITNGQYMVAKQVVVK